MDKALIASDELEKALKKRIADVYGEALKRAVRNNRAFLTNVKNLDEHAKKLEAGGWTSEKIEKWRKEEVLRLLRQQRLVQNIAAEMDRAGMEIAQEIKARMAEVYKVNSDATFRHINSRVNANFALIPKAQVKIILDDAQPVFSKIAYQHLGKNKVIRDSLQSQMAQAAILGESQEKIIKRIQKVTGQAEYQARRVAQTERNRVQSQARADAMHEAAQAGVIITKKWSARMRNTRDSHAALNGVEIPENEKFRTIWGNELRYPGDPEAPAKEVINCFVKETRIASNTSVEAATEREYIGELVTIETRGGIKFTCTPNHPVLTDKGWIAAGALYEGCNILTSGFAENFCSWIYPNKNNVVPCIYDIYQLFSRISFVNRIARGLVNFHGDIPDTDVKVVFSPCFLQNRGKPLFFKKIKHFFFKFSDFEKATFSCKCMIYKFTSLGWRSASRFIRFLRNFCFFFIGGMLETKKLRFAKAANRTAVFKKKTINSSSIQSFSVCDGIDRFPGDVTVDDIISVKRRENVACHVYNLQTENQIYGVNESISQNGEKHNCKFAIVHNCHCVLIPDVKLPSESTADRLIKGKK